MKKASGSSPEAFFVSPERKSSGTRTLLLERVNGFAPLFPLSLILLLKLDTVLAVLLIPGRAFSAFLSEVSPLLLSLRLAVSGVRRALIVGRDIFGFLRSLRGVRGAALSDALTSVAESDFQSAIDHVQMIVAQDLPVLSLYFRGGSLVSYLDMSSLDGLSELNTYNGLEYWQGVAG